MRSGWCMVAIGTAAHFAYAPRATPAGRSAGQQPPTWALGSTPRLRLGDDADPRTTFGDARVIRTGAGALVVLDGATKQLRLYSDKGAFVQLLARAGAGPGELRRPSLLLHHLDTVRVVENSPGPQLVHSYRVGRGFLAQERITPANSPRGVILQARLSSGQYLAAAGDGKRRVDPTLQDGVAWRDSIRLGVMAAPEGGQIQWIGTFPNDTRWSFTVPAFGPSPTSQTVAGGSRLVRCASGSQIWIGDSDLPTIEVYSESGQLIRRVTLPIPSRALNATVLDRLRQRAIAEANNAAGRLVLNAFYTKAARPKNAPHFASCLAGVRGDVWIELYREDPDATTTWLVVGSDGTMRARVTTPARFSLQHVSEDAVAGIARDEIDAERVEVYTIQRR
ncbi:MAG: hypothetical protein IT353_23535 [Gemmatimonadaceae bacterium]|nr:hypothetical protein [Gemmatimonadaceae bacterium]